MTSETAQPPVIIVGGGLAGLSAAAILAHAGYKVTLFEKAAVLGGRSRTKSQDDFFFNLGAHAFYLGGSGERLLRTLRVSYSGQQLKVENGLAIEQGNIHVLPFEADALKRTTLLSMDEKAELINFYASLKDLNKAEFQGVCWQMWLEQHVRYHSTRQFLVAFARLLTETNAPDLLDAGLIIHLMRKMPVVLYLDNGWQTLVKGLSEVAQQNGATLMTHAKVAAVEVEMANEVRAVRLVDGIRYPAAAVLLAVDPYTASQLVAEGKHEVLSSWAKRTIPARVACFDVALRRLPQPNNVYALGMDRPLYFAVHSAWAKLAPQDGACIHTMKYLRPDALEEPEVDRQELGSFLDQLQPGWRAEVITQRFLPHMLATNAIVQAGQDGINGRPGPEVPGICNLYVAGDWVGREDQLAGAAFASATHAAELIKSSLISLDRQDYHRRQHPSKW